jgi:ribonuclease-3
LDNRKVEQVVKRSLETLVSVMEALLDIEFRTKLLLVQALTHRSYLNEHTDHPTTHYERLECLGDALLEAIVTEFLFRKFPEASEGELTHYRAALVNSEALAGIANQLNLQDYALFSKGEARGGDKARNYIGTCLVEALIGAIYLDQGWGSARMWVDHVLLSRTSKILAAATDHKSALQELAQKKFGVTPTYRVVSDEGPSHAKSYEMACMIGKQEVSRGTGQSKKEAEVAAAQQARETISQWEGRITEVAGQAGSVMRRSGNRGRR